MYKYYRALYAGTADKSSDKTFGWDAMMHRDAVKAAVRNAQAIQWVKTHTIQDLEDLVYEMSTLGEDVTNISQLLDDLMEIDRSLQTDAETIPEPEMSEYAEIAG
jgi:hypothetical protein